eukprot:CAMPEP_0174381396 /NCGR_PEP_ID=MMETSP0811_2-20130205/123982_1 /TAXON_ID=73025 ORGANISM="Eutreptiella gymnastica-like, Strain CCMP1594" /NCGR_SAMPLE_ID=MMETSP0811_2 /ASSEMBLY_ACC=CAM_ASM_000667 /LENGTH=47 /DNA_ID= /DNA_START= /DNA_END= /DNA_ORIENTATION=
MERSRGIVPEDKQKATPTFPTAPSCQGALTGAQLFNPDPHPSKGRRR